MTPSVSAVLFAKDAHRLVKFYVAVFGARVLAEDEYRAALDVRGFRLVVHQIPPHLARDVEVRTPPLRRESGAIRLDYPVGDVVKAGIDAKLLGGGVDQQPPAWAAADGGFFLGFDPEGNVFGISGESQA